MTTNTLSFIESKRTTYGHVISQPEVNFQVADASGNFIYEFMAREHDLGAVTAVRMEIFDESWMAFTDFPELFQLLAINDNMRTIPEFAELLRANNITENRTNYR